MKALKGERAGAGCSTNHSDIVICCLPHLVMTLQEDSNMEMRSVANIKVKGTVLWD